MAIIKKYFKEIRVVLFLEQVISVLKSTTNTKFCVHRNQISVITILSSSYKMQNLSDEF